MTRTIPVATAALALLALVGCAAGAAEPSASPAPSSSASAPESSATSAPSEEPAGIDTSGWLEYATHDGDLTYRYPADWTLESESVQDPNDASSRWYDTASLTAPNGQQLLQSGDFVDIGGACGEDDRYPIEILADEPADVDPQPADGEPRIVSVALGTDDGRWIFGMGIASPERLPAPGSTACGFYFVHGSSDGGLSVGTHFMMASIGDDPLWTVDTLDDARAYMETDEYATILEILRSVRLA